MQDNKDLALLKEAAFACGTIAKSFFRKNPKVWEKANDAGPVTEADISINRMLKSELLFNRPDFGWLSEETEDYPDRLSKENTFIISHKGDILFDKFTNIIKFEKYKNFTRLA